MSRSEIPIFQVDAFTEEPFRGNPAAVCLLDEERDEGWMQAVAAEMNLSETAFPRPVERGYALRWFTPALEVALCGHATLATAHVLWETGRLAADREAVFHTKSGELRAVRRGTAIELDFPALPSDPAELSAGARRALGVTARNVALVPARSIGEDNWIVELESEEVLRNLSPDFAALRESGSATIMATARGSGEFDFVSRYFAPAVGIDEDPVTGSMHCALGPYWSPRLGKTRFKAFQASSRGGVIEVELRGDRALLRGRAHTVLRGVLLV
jgi:PhzF family phenazine biosynthesis protein